MISFIYKKQLVFFTVWLLIFSSVSNSSIRFNNLAQLDSEFTLQVIRDMAEDGDGNIWLGTGFEGLYRFDGHQVTYHPLFNNGQTESIKAIHKDESGRVWIGTDNHGILQLIDGQLVPLMSDEVELSNEPWIKIISLATHQVLFMTNNNIYLLNLNNELSEITPAELAGQQLTSMLSLDHKLIVGTDNSIHILNIETDNLSFDKTIHLKHPVKEFTFDHMGHLWLATNAGLYKSSSQVANLHSFELILEGNFMDVVATKDSIWAGSLYDGLIQIHTDTDELKYHKHQKTDPYSLNENNVLSLFVDQQNNLWAGTFNSGINYFNLDALSFGLQRSIPTQLWCAETEVYYGFLQIQDEWWIASERGLINYQPQSGECQLFSHQPNDSTSLSHHLIYSLSYDQEGFIWISTARGLNRLDLQTKTIDPLHTKTPRNNTYFAVNADSNKTILGTKNGLFLYDSNIGSSRLLGQEISNISNTVFYNFHKSQNGNWYFATDQGLFSMDESFSLDENIKINSQLPGTGIVSVHTDGTDQIWLGSVDHGLYLFDLNGQLIKHYQDADGVPAKETIYTVLDNGQSLWLGTSHGLVRLDKLLDQGHIFYKEDGLQGDFFTLGAAYQGPDGLMFFGGRKGFNAFYPGDIQPLRTMGLPRITHLKLFNKIIEPGKNVGAFHLSESVNQLDLLTLSHEELVVGFEFNVADILRAKQINYAYQLQGFDQSWQYVDASNRQANYTNLPAGKYEFKVKATYDTSDWDQPVKTLAIKVLPAPWLTWWAITSYILLFVSIVGWLIYRKISADARLAAVLRIEVAEKTKELNTQKSMVESLLAKKNELFSHISHEFRTPLTLILGPINELIKQQKKGESLRSLKIINKNANRLLSLVEQLLQIAKVSSFDKVQLQRQETSEVIKSIVDSFQHVANNKSIRLQLKNNEVSHIEATDQCLDAILGNLISNAIKYSPNNSTILVNAQNKDNQFILSVADQGPGLTAEQQAEIFKMFSRLEHHSDVGGVGIGLAVVEEMVKINNGHIKVYSELGNGAKFEVTFALSEKPAEIVHPQPSNSTLIDILSMEEPHDVVHHQTTTQDVLVTNKDTILVIEDNHDMRSFIIEILSEHYHCIEAENGQRGVAQAIEYIPDLVVCDVMMPIMDGFEVSRNIRTEEKTSHIPLLLLTALNDKANRIKGWQENIDSYMTKPFDRDELLIRIENILSVRNILKKKASILLDQGQANQIKLAKKDQDFVDKLNHIIENNYSDSLLNRTKMADQMAVSDRQLQRKLKALIDQNPMDYLRIYRLNKAKSLLKDGYQVSQVSDECGFNSLSYFSYSFKAQFGLSPKAFQTKSI
ncbi:MAG: hybrid sensor histidine kinase/response regulator transcription factor [Marinicella sp.]